MGKLSKFHKIYANNKEVIYEDARVMSRQKFLDKYHIGQQTYLQYFKGVTEYTQKYLRTPEQRERERELYQQRKLTKAEERESKNLRSFQDSVTQLAEKFKVNKTYIIQLTQHYAISEIEQGEKVGDRIVVKDLIVMRKPKCIEESMYSFNSGVV